MWNQAAGEAWTRRNSRVQAWLSLAITVVVVGGAFLLLVVSGAAGLYIAPPIAQLARGTFDYLDILFLILWASTFHAVSIHNGLRYQFTVFTVHVPRTPASDVGGFIGFTVVAIVWGALVHIVFASRAVDPIYVNRRPPGAQAAALQAGVVEVTTTYFVVAGLVLVLVVIARFFNPIDFAEYGRNLRTILHLPSSRTPIR